MLGGFGGRGTNMRRREFIRLIGGIATWPLGAQAQHAQTPVIGYINSRSPTDSVDIVSAFREGLKEAGFIETKNVTIESRFAAGNFAKLTDLAADLLHHQPDVIVATGGTVSAVKIKPVVPPTIPIVFAMGGDPVKLGLVNSLNRPGGNMTGVAFLVNGLASKQIELLHELMPKAGVVGFWSTQKIQMPSPMLGTPVLRRSPCRLSSLSVRRAPRANWTMPSAASRTSESRPSSWTPSLSSWISTRRSLHWRLNVRWPWYLNSVRSPPMELWRHTARVLPKPTGSLVFIQAVF